MSVSLLPRVMVKRPAVVLLVAVLVGNFGIVKSRRTKEESDKREGRSVHNYI